MRLNEFISILLEYNKQVTKEKLGDKLVATSQLDNNQNIDQILTTLEQIDPTPHKQYVEWLCRQYIARQFRLEDAPRINDVLSNFENIKRNLQQRDINKYSFRSLEAAIDKELNIELNNDSSENYNIDGVKILYDGVYGVLTIPETEEASCALGAGTKWCTAANKNNMFAAYSKNKPLYIWKDKSGAKFQFSFDSMQFMDAKDEPIDKKLITFFRNKHPILSTLFKQNEQTIMRDPVKAAEYAIKVLHNRWPEAEDIIMTDPDIANAYAKEVIKGRWPEAEKMIASTPVSAFIYASSIINGRWPEAEDIIMTSPSTATSYARFVIRGRWPEAEKVIMTDAYAAATYAIEIIKGRWPEAEDIIMTNPSTAAGYARFVIRGRWPEAEKVIMTDAYAAATYAKDVINKDHHTKS
jgi:ribosomal 50S subunit-associated protein YjgA (DUF615 family)